MNKWNFIDWEETQQRFNYTSQKLKAADRVLVRCCQCDTFIEVRYDSVRGRRGKPYEPACRSCNSKKQWENQDQEHKQSIAAKTSLSMQKVWNDEEYVRNQKEKHIISGKLKWQDDEYRAKVKSGVKRAHANNPEYAKSAIDTLRKAVAAQKKTPRKKTRMSRLSAQII